MKPPPNKIHLSACAAVATAALGGCTFFEPDPPKTAMVEHRTERVLPPCLSVKRIRRGDLAFTVEKPGNKVETLVYDMRTAQIERVGSSPLALAGWSPSGEQLLLDDCYSPSDDSDSMPTLAFWAPLNALPGAADWLGLPAIDGALHAFPYPAGRRRRVLQRGSLGAGGQGNVIWSTEGRLAWSMSLSQLEASDISEQTLYVRASLQDPEVTELTLSEDITTLYYRIVDWVPGTSMVLAGRGALGVESWIQGVPMVVIDTVTGEIRDLDLPMLLTPEAYAWHPSGTGWVAIASGESPYLFESGRLVLLDPGSGETTYLTPLDLAAFEPSWSPDGARLAYAAVEAAPEMVDEAQPNDEVLIGRSIYVLDVESGESVQVTDPGNAIDGWPQWMPGGNRLLYTRQHHGQSEIRMLRLDEAKDDSIMAGLPDPPCQYAGCSWRQLLAYSPGPPAEPVQMLDMARVRSLRRVVKTLAPPGARS